MEPWLSTLRQSVCRLVRKAFSFQIPENYLDATCLFVTKQATPVQTYRSWHDHCSFNGIHPAGMVIDLEQINDYPNNSKDSFEVPAIVRVGRSILPFKAVLAGLLHPVRRSRKSRCVIPRHPQSAFTTVTSNGDKNPIWGDDAPLSMEEAAMFVGIPLGTLRQKVYAREIESRRVGKRRMVQPSALRAYLEKHRLPAL